MYAMRRICTLLGLLVVGLLTGCSSGAEPVDNPAPASEPEVICNVVKLLVKKRGKVA